MTHKKTNSTNLALEQTPLFFIPELKNYVASHWKLTIVSSKVRPTFCPLGLFPLTPHFVTILGSEKQQGFAVG